MVRKKGDATVGLLLVTVVFICSAILFSIFIYGVSKSEIEALKEREQGGTELYTLMEQDFCTQGIPLREAIGQGIVQRMSSDTDELIYYTNNGESVSRITVGSLKQCIEQYMNFVKNVNHKSVDLHGDPFISAATCVTFRDAPPERFENAFLKRVCVENLSYRLTLEHMRCTGQCLSLGALDPTQTDVPKQVIRIAVPDGTVATAVLWIKRA